MNKTLLVIDMQNFTIGENHANIFRYENKLLLKNINRHIEEYKNVVYIKHTMKRNFMNHFSPFKAYEGTNEIELVEGLSVVSNNMFYKYQGNAFSNTELVHWLQENAIREIGIVGVDGGGCVALTAIGALKNNFEVVLYEDSIGTTFTKKKNKYFKKLKSMGAKFA